jgi:hypothetical protein
MYRIDSSRADLAREFKAAPFGPHSPELQKVVQVMRWGSSRGKTIIICTKHHREWKLGCMGAARGQVVTEVGPAFTSYAEATWACFRARWQEATGQACPVE